MTLINDFFQGGQEESDSPFLTRKTRWLAKNLSLKASIFAAFFLLLSFLLSFEERALPLSYLMLVFVYFLVAPPSLIETIEDLITLEVNIDVLMTLAALSSVFIGNGFEGALLLVLFSLSHSMEDAVTAKAKSAISHLSKLSPTKAFVLQPDGSLLEKALFEIKPQTEILVKAHEVVPLDGLIIKGTSSVNLVHLTGENFPLRKTVNDEVPAGARNLEGSLILKVLRTSQDSTLSKIVELVTKAQEAKPLLQRSFEALSKRYAITIILLAFFLALLMPYVFKIPFLGANGSLYRSLAFLIAASPCALIIAIPVAYLSGISACAKNGILLKGGHILEALAECQTIAFDKTGTLTKGELFLESIQTVRGGSFVKASDEEAIEALKIAYGLEKQGTHPVGKALIEAAKGRGVAPYDIEEFRSIPGSGVHGTFKGSSFFLGRVESKEGSFKEQIESLKREAFLVTVLKTQVKKEEKLTFFCLRDTIRPNLKKTVENLKHKGLTLVMLTGDHEGSAQKVAKELDLPQYFADLRPEDKLELVSSFSEKGGLIMVGDGMNDAPALARATVGISLGQVGSRAAIDASDIVFLKDNIEFLDWLVEKAVMTRKIVRQNLIVASGAIVFAALPALLGFVPLWAAVILHEGGTVLVGLNALRLLKNN